jgi:hypothetical protein
MAFHTELPIYKVAYDLLSIAPMVRAIIEGRNAI